MGAWEGTLRYRSCLEGSCHTIKPEYYSDIFTEAWFIYCKVKKSCGIFNCVTRKVCVILYKNVKGLLSIKFGRNCLSSTEVWDLILKCVVIRPSVVLLVEVLNITFAAMECFRSSALPTSTECEITYITISQLSIYLDFYSSCRLQG